MARFIKQGVARDGAGNVIAGATISVYEAGTTTVANIYATASGGTAVNSVESGTDGSFSFYVDDGDYARTQKFKIVLSKSNYTSQTWDNVILMDASEVAAAAVLNTAGTSTSGNLPMFNDTSGLSVEDSGVALTDLLTKDDYAAHSILAADTAGTPVAVELAASQLIGRKATGEIVALSKADLQTIINVEDGANNYNLPTASTDTLGGVKVGSGLGVSEGVLSTEEGSDEDAVHLSEEAEISTLSDKAAPALNDIFLIEDSASSPAFGKKKISYNTIRDYIREEVSTWTGTFTNKRITKRTVAVTSHATPTLNTDNADIATILALDTDITNMSTNLSGTPVAGDMILFRFKDDGTARAIEWGTSFESYLEALPTTTVESKELAVLFLYRSKWSCVYAGSEA